MMDLEDLAGRADRAMRTSAARSTAQSVYDMLRDGTPILDALASRRGWSRRSDAEYVCAFGNRTSVVAVPQPFDRDQMAHIVVRTEVNVFLGGGADDLLLRELQSLAQRELQQLLQDGT